MEKRIQEMMQLSPLERQYRSIFVQNPDVYFYEKKGRPYRNWEEFRQNYQETAGQSETVPKEAPSLFGQIIQESDFFSDKNEDSNKSKDSNKNSDKNKDVDINWNARYCPPFWHHLSFLKIMYVVQGELYINLSDRHTICLKKGNFIIVPPDVEHSVFSCNDDDMVINLFLKLSTFETAFASMLMEADTFSVYFWQMLYGRNEESMIWFDSLPDEFLENLIWKMDTEKENPKEGGNFLLISYVMTFVAYALAYHKDDMKPVNGLQFQTEHFPAMIQYIRRNYNTVTLSSLAEHFHRSEGYLSRYIRRETGYTLVQLLKRYRMKQAGIMLRETMLSVEQVMLEVGYTDISYFYKVFRQHFGVTPKKYRETQRIVPLL